MKPLKKASLPPLTEEQRAGLARFAQEQNFGQEQLEESIREVYGDEVWMNDLYQVNVRRMKNSLFSDAPDLVHLSIKRRDKAPVRNWRHLQQIKNQLVGAECEGVELYPAESRKTDTANQYHLWVMDDPTYRFPFGFKERVVTDKDYGVGSRQEPLD